MIIKDFLRKENNNLDLIRIFCASLVIIGHSYRLEEGNGVDVIERFTHFTYSGGLAVTIFFFISGMLVTHSLLKKQSIKSFLISRLFRILPGLLFVLVITAFLIGPAVSIIPVAEYFRNSTTYLYVIKNAAFQSFYILPGVFTKNDYKNVVNGSLWSIRYEVACYLLLLTVFTICFYTIKKYKSVYNIIIAAAFIGLISIMFINDILSKQLLSTSVLEHSLLLMSFALGTFFAVNEERISLNYKYISVAIILTILFWHFKVVNQFFFNMSCCFLVFPIAKSKVIRKIKVRYDISYGIYLWGFIIQQTIFYLMGRQNIYLFMAISLVLTTIMGLISYLIVEKRFIDWGHALDKRTNRPAASQEKFTNVTKFRN